MLTDDKVVAGNNADVDDNVNTRDQKRSGIILLVLIGLFFAGLVGLGLSHAPESNQTAEQQQDTSGSGAQPIAGGEQNSNFDINRPIGPVELPGTIGKPQSFLSGHGNTPAQGVSPGVSPTAASDEQSLGKAQSGATASDTTPTGKDSGNNTNMGMSGQNTSNQSGSNIGATHRRRHRR